jgi:hypothetical protein
MGWIEQGQRERTGRKRAKLPPRKPNLLSLADLPLVGEAVDVARRQAYERMVRWANAGLTDDSSRRLSRDLRKRFQHYDRLLKKYWPGRQRRAVSLDKLMSGE